MFMRRRRPLLRAAMVGGAGYMAGKAGQRNQYHEADQEQRIEQLEGQQGAPAAAPAAAPAPAAGGDDLVAKLQQLSELQKSGALSQDEFEAAKKKLLAG